MQLNINMKLQNFYANSKPMKKKKLWLKISAKKKKKKKEEEMIKQIINFITPHFFFWEDISHIITNF